MDVAYITALSALGGSVVGGLTSGFTTWLTQRTQVRTGQLAQELSRREDLYNDFIVEASNAYGKAIASNEPQIQEFLGLYAMISRMRVMAFPRTVAYAEKTMRAVLDTYLAPNQTVLELHELITSGETAIDPLKEFSEAAREELAAFTSR